MGVVSWDCKDEDDTSRPKFHTLFWKGFPHIMETKPTIGWSNFARNRHTADSGNSYTTLNRSDVVQLILDNWDRRVAGDGEEGRLDRKVLVPVDPEKFFCPPKAKLVMGMPVQAEVVRRQDHEAPYVEHFVTPEDAAKHGAVVEVPANFVEIVVYSAEALLENDGERSSECEWEIVCLLAQTGYKTEPMPPLTMARNQLEKPGGTAGTYTDKEYAESIWHYANKGVTIRRPRE